jgi:DNA-binding transcriptional ArsR family regulator
MSEMMKSPPLIDRGEPELDIDALIASAQEASGFLKALAHEGRLLILCLLVEEEKSVTEIEEILGLRQPAISQQLARLRADGLLQTRREGKNVFYSLARPEVRAIISALHRAFCREPRLRAFPVRHGQVARAAARAKGAGRRVRPVSIKRRPRRAQ